MLPFLHHHHLQCLCLLQLALLSVCGCKICHACKCVRVLLSQYMLPFLHHHHLQCLCLLPLALVSVCGCRICHACKCVRVLLSQYMLPFLEVFTLPPFFRADSGRTPSDSTYPECQFFGSGTAGSVR